MKSALDTIDLTSEADVKKAIGGLESEISDLHTVIDDLKEELRETNENVTSLEEELAAVPDELRDFSQHLNESGARAGVAASLEVALAHAQATFGFHMPETKVIESLTELCKP